MKTNLFLGLALLSMAPNAVSAQENADSLYIRNSVYMLKLDMPADNEEYAHAYEVTNKAFDGIDFATRYPNYNDFNLGSHHIDWSTVPTATKAEMDAIEKESAKDALLKTTLASMGVKVDPIAEREYAARLLNYFNVNKFGNQLVAKWHVPQGADYKNVAAWDEQLGVIMALGMKGLSDEARENAKQTQNLVALCGNSENKLLGTTYVCVNNYRMMNAKEKSATAIAMAKVTLEFLPGIDGNEVEWKKVGTIKVAKNSVWDNQEGANETLEGEAEDGEKKEGNAELKYTIFDGKPGKKIGEGCLIRLAK